MVRDGSPKMGAEEREARAEDWRDGKREDAVLLKKRARELVQWAQDPASGVPMRTFLDVVGQVERKPQQVVDRLGPLWARKHGGAT